MIGMGVGDGSMNRSGSEFCLEDCNGNTPQSAGAEQEGLILP